MDRVDFLITLWLVYGAPFLILGAVLRLIVKRAAADHQPKAQISPSRERMLESGEPLLVKFLDAARRAGERKKSGDRALFGKLLDEEMDRE